MSVSRRAVLSGAIAAATVHSVRAHAEQAAWVACQPMPISRSEMPATELGGLIYIAGGFGAENKAHAYDPETDTWTRLPDLPVETNHPGITTWNGNVVVAGGYTSDGANAHSGIWALRPGDAQWTQIGTLPHAMGAFGFASVPNEIVLCGGAIDALNGHPTDETWVWSPESDTWTGRSPIPRGREHLAMVARDGLIYVAGGRVHGQASPELGSALDIYDPVSDSWIAGNPLDPPRSGLNGANTSAGIVVAGGETPTDVFDDVNLLDPATGEWIALPALPVPVHGVAVAALGGNLFSLGGSKSAGAIDNVTEVWRLDVPNYLSGRT